MEDKNFNNINITDRKNKRKQLQNEEQEQENEEEEMEQFFALIRNTKEIHDRLRNSEGLKEESKKKMEEQKAAARPSATWNPTFQPEDFMEGDINNIIAKTNFIGENQQLGTSSKRQENEEEKEKAEAKKESNNELDLNLSL